MNENKELKKIDKKEMSLEIQEKQESRDFIKKRNFFLIFLDLIKPRQTALLMYTAVASFILTTSGEFQWDIFGLLLFSLFFTVSGSTMLNMAIDSDIDRFMDRTKKRAIPRGEISKRAVYVLGSVFSIIGLIGAFSINMVTGWVIFAGLFIDVYVYTVLLKRASPYSIIMGAIAGGMPALAGRTALTGSIDLIGVLIASLIVFWVPTHIWTLAIITVEDYRKAGVKMWPVVYGFEDTVKKIVYFDLAMVLNVILLGHLLSFRLITWALVTIPSLIFLMYSVQAYKEINEKNLFIIFKAASMYLAMIFLLLSLDKYFPF